MPQPNLVYQIFQAEDGSVALADADGNHVTYRSNWGDLLHWLRSFFHLRRCLTQFG